METDSISNRKMVEDALFNLRWDAQRSALLGSMASLYREEAFVDTTIVADNKIYKAHKLLLSASSSYLKLILESVPSSQHAVLFMPHIGASDLGNVLKFIYEGEIKINKRSLKSFLTVARLLRIKGMDFELNEDLEVNISQASAQTPSMLPNSHKRRTSESCADDTTNNSVPSSKASTSSSITSQSRTEGPSTSIKESVNGGSLSVGTDDESIKKRPALITSNGRSTDSLSSQVSVSNNIPSSPSSESHKQSNNNNNHIHSDETPDLVNSANGNESNDESQHDDSNHSDNTGSRKALDLHIRRFHDNESLDMDHDDCNDNGRDDRDEHGMSIPDHDDMDDDYDDDDDHNFSMSIQPEVSLRESDESFNVNDNRHQSMQQYKPINFSSSFCGLPMLYNSSMSITQTPGGPNGQLSSGSSTLSLQQHMTLKHLSKLARPTLPKGDALPGQSSPQSGPISGINEGILMRMMREPLQGASNKPISNASNHSHTGFFDIKHDPNLHPAGLRKQKRYVQCTSCSKVLSSLSALKRHMEDVHCARIQGKCLLCGRVYSSRNSLLTHVYSAHKKHHDYKAVARIIRESDFEQFATA